ncbi:MAG: hypothetical protein OQJ93_08740 [Ignavibacteriaceae bacterium]|nr:hypothetical protein [Ignavibacteriaceae bacterium]MCW8960500.1 hypothetical protein [Ignavibacteriaceae bacterium]MCW9097462.1 hypothetical protein [Ignavibacteriaceae bacterium]
MLLPIQKKTDLILLVFKIVKILNVAASVGPSSKVKRILLFEVFQIKFPNNFWTKNGG